MRFLSIVEVEEGDEVGERDDDSRRAAMRRLRPALERLSFWRTSEKMRFACWRKFSI